MERVEAHVATGWSVVTTRSSWVMPYSLMDQNSGNVSGKSPPDQNHSYVPFSAENSTPGCICSPQYWLTFASSSPVGPGMAVTCQVVGFEQRLPSSPACTLKSKTVISSKSSRTNEAEEGLSGSSVNALDQIHTSAPGTPLASNAMSIGVQTNVSGKEDGLMLKVGLTTTEAWSDDDPQRLVPTTETSTKDGEDPSLTATQGVSGAGNAPSSLAHSQAKLRLPP